MNCTNLDETRYSSYFPVLRGFSTLGKESQDHYAKDMGKAKADAPSLEIFYREHGETSFFKPSGLYGEKWKTADHARRIWAKKTGSNSQRVAERPGEFSNEYNVGLRRTPV